MARPKKQQYFNSDNSLVTTSDRYGFITYNEPSSFEPLLKAHCKHWAYICHDKDDKVKHWHIIAVFDDKKTPNVAISIFKSLPQNTMINNIRYGVASYEYLTHNSDGARKDGKHVYDCCLIHQDDDDYWVIQWRTDTEVKKALEAEKAEEWEQSNEAFLLNLLAPKIDVKKMAMKYGRDFIKNYQSYMNFRYEVLKDEAREQEELYKGLVEMGCETVEMLSPDVKLWDKIYTDWWNNLKSEASSLNTEIEIDIKEFYLEMIHTATIVGKTPVKTSGAEHYIYFATIKTSNVEGLKTISFYGTSDIDIGAEVAVRPHKRYNDGQWIYLLSSRKENLI
jgi:hypothetical protein